MHGEPERRLAGVGPDHAMADMGGDFEIIAGTQPARRRLAFDQQFRRAGQHGHPFGPGLIVPEAGRTRLPLRKIRSTRAPGKAARSWVISSPEASGRSAKKLPVLNMVIKKPPPRRPRRSRPRSRPKRP